MIIDISFRGRLAAWRSNVRIGNLFFSGRLAWLDFHPV